MLPGEGPWEFRDFRGRGIVLRADTFNVITSKHPDVLGHEDAIVDALQHPIAVYETEDFRDARRIYYGRWRYSQRDDRLFVIVVALDAEPHIISAHQRIRPRPEGVQVWP